MLLVNIFHSVTQGLACQNVPVTGTVSSSPEDFAGYKLLEKSVKMNDEKSCKIEKGIVSIMP